MKISDSMPMHKLLKEAARRAKGYGKLVDARGRSCFWGQAARLAGVPAKKLKGYDIFLDTPGTLVQPLTTEEGDMAECPGSSDWDAEDKASALASACAEIGNCTVADFRSMLQKNRLLPMPKDKKS